MTSYAQLRGFRARAGFTQADLGGIIGAHVNSIARWERGEGYPSADTLAAWLDACSCTDAEIVAVLRAIIAERKGGPDGR